MRDEGGSFCLRRIELPSSKREDQHIKNESVYEQRKQEFTAVKVTQNEARSGHSKGVLEVMQPIEATCKLESLVANDDSCCASSSRLTQYDQDPLTQYQDHQQDHNRASEQVNRHSGENVTPLANQAFF